MAYYDTYLLRADPDFSSRVAACYATETPLGTGTEPSVWAQEHGWDVASAPGFGDAYASAILADVPFPGRDPSVISDAQILSAVQVIVGQETPANA